MTFIDFCDKHKVTEEEVKPLYAYLVALKIVDFAPAIEQYALKRAIDLKYHKKKKS